MYELLLGTWMCPVIHRVPFQDLFLFHVVKMHLCLVRTLLPSYSFQLAGHFALLLRTNIDCIIISILCSIVSFKTD